MKKLFSLVVALVFLFGGMATVSAYYDDILPEDAYDMLNPSSTNFDYPYNPNAYILDVRTPCEWNWIGHPGKDKCGNGAFLEEPVRKVINIPWELWEFDPKTKQYGEELNKFFDEEVVRQFDPDNVIIIMCRSGSRSVSASKELEDPCNPEDKHPACKRLEELGFYHLYNMVGGFEGGRNETDTDPANCQHRTKDEGWKNKGLPYIDNAEGIWTPKQRGRSLGK